MKNRLPALLLLLTFCLSGCSLGNSASTPQIAADSLTADVAAQPVTPSGALDLAAQTPALSEFGIRLFEHALTEGENTLISPLSVLTALSMTANGAKGETLAQMESVLGLPLAALNDYSYFYVTQMPQSDRCKVSVANSIWFTQDDRFTVNRAFLQTAVDYYSASVFRAPFDQTTCDAINGWVKNETDGMIDRILDEIPADAVMYLINALSFDAEWSSIYETTQIYSDRFTQADGSQTTVEFMRSEEELYLEDDLATGFVKYYSGGDYAFVDLLPNEGITPEEYIASLTGENLTDLLSNPIQTTVYATLPKFETEFNAELSSLLAAMGMPNAFGSSLADLTGLGTSTAGNLYINRVLHKTFLSVDERGTKAGAVTVIEVNDECAPFVEDPKTVTVDRPFVYLIVDCTTNLPLFLGVTQTIP